MKKVKDFTKAERQFYDWISQNYYSIHRRNIYTGSDKGEEQKSTFVNRIFKWFDIKKKTK